MTTEIAKAGAAFLLGDIDVESLSTAERLSDEQRMLRDTTRRFVEDQIRPRIAELEEFNPKLLKDLLRKSAEIGLCMIDIPEAEGGLGLDFFSSIQATEIMAWGGGGFQVTHSVHTSIGLLPILYFAGPELRSRYVSKIATAELVTAYALTESGSGSDALAARTSAVLSEDGSSWILNGSKQFITNGAIADVFVVFAKVDGRDFSAFVVDRDAPGFTVGPEEHKLGIHASSTTTLSFSDCRIPKENLIGEVGWGAKIALNALNVGRLKLGVAAIGAAKESLEVATRYALERRQFGRAIAEFGIIREKIAEMAARIYAGESTMLRTAGLVTQAIEGESAEAGVRTPQAMMSALKEFSVECAIEKVQGSETQAFCADEALQILGGYGFIEEYPAARFYRDARITRLYEGTNEINRIKIAGDVLKRFGGEVHAETAGGNGSDEDARLFGSLADVAEHVRSAKSALLRLLRMTHEGKAGKIDKRGGNQEILQRLADIVIAIYGMESSMGRAVQAAGSGSDHAPAFETLCRVYAAQASLTMLGSVREVIMLMDGEESESSECEIESQVLGARCNVIELRRAAAGIIIDREGNWFN